jgi:hypothetical protein
LPQFRAPALRGTMTVEEALRRLLAGSGWIAVHISATTYRIERAPPRRPAPARPKPLPIVSANPLRIPTEDIVVTAQKRRQLLEDLAVSVSVVPLEDSATRRLVDGARDLALSVEGLAVTNLGPGRIGSSFAASPTARSTAPASPRSRSNSMKPASLRCARP